MRNVNIIAQPTLRFRRWSRKGYAMFCSLGRGVTIGALSKGVVDRSLKKQVQSEGGCLADSYADWVDDRIDDRDRDWGWGEALCWQRIATIGVVKIEINIVPAWGRGLVVCVID